MQESAMECPIEEIVGEPEKSEEWGNYERNQMDYEQGFDEEGEQEQYEASSSVVEKPREHLHELIQAHKMNKLKLEEILKVQVANIVELQNVCEKVSFTVDQIPALRELGSQRCNQVLSEIQGLRTKQSQLSELIDYSVQKYDEDLQLVYSLREEFDAQKHLNYERCTVFDADLLDLAATGTSFFSIIDAITAQKREFSELLQNHLAELEKVSDAVNDLNAKIDLTYENANLLNSTLLENESKLANSTKNSAEVKNQIQLENSKFSQKMEDYERKELEASVDLNILRGKIDKTRSELDRLWTDTEESKSKLAFLKNQHVELENDKQLKAAAELALTFQLTELSDQRSTLCQTLSGLTRCKNMISAGENDIGLLEAELGHLTSRSVDLENKRGEIHEQIVSYEKYLQEAVDRTEALENEYKKLAKELPPLKISYTKETQEVKENEMKTADELSHHKVVCTEMEDSFNKLSTDLELSQSKLSSLRLQNTTLKESIAKKRSSAINKEETVESVTTDLESCAAEWDVLSEQERTGLETVNVVKQLNNQLNERRNQLSRVSETANQMLLEMNEENNKMVEEKVRETESKKREYRKHLEELANEGAKIEGEYKLLRSDATAFHNHSKDVSRQNELFSSENSLYRTFAQYVFNDGSILPWEEDLITSTSDANVFRNSQQTNQDINLEVRDVKTSYK